MIKFLQTFLSFLAQHRWVAILWTLLILLACSWPGKDIPAAPAAGFDKLVHAGLFAVWTILWLLAYPAKRNLVIVLGMAYGLGLEFYQQILPLDRTFDWWDALADSVGVLLGYSFKSILIDRYLQRLY